MRLLSRALVSRFDNKVPVPIKERVSVSRRVLLKFAVAKAARAQITGPFVVVRRRSRTAVEFVSPRENPLHHTGATHRMHVAGEHGATPNHCKHDSSLHPCSGVVQPASYSLEHVVRDR